MLKTMDRLDPEALKIKSAQTYLIEVPVPVLRIDSSSDIEAWQVLAVCLRSQSEHEGWGYQTGFGPVMSIIRRFLEQDILPQLLGRTALTHRDWWGNLYLRRHHIGLNGPTIQGISAPEIAAWDLIARADEVPLWRLISDTAPTSVSCYNTDVGWLGYSENELISNVNRAVENGFKAVKIKIGSEDFTTDLKRLEKLRSAVGPDLTIAVDVNSRWDINQAMQYAPDLTDFDIAWLEEPLYPFDVDGHARLAKGISTPLLHGESICEPLLFEEMIRAGAMEIAQPSNMKLGGISRWLRVASFAQAEGLRIVPAGWTMMQIDQHLAAAVRGCWMVEWIPWIRDIFVEPVSFRDGSLIVPDSPGASTKIKPELLN